METKNITMQEIENSELLMIDPDASFREVAADVLGISPRDIQKIQRAGTRGWTISFETPEELEEGSEWMSPKDMGIAQKIDWSDDKGNEISDDEKLAYFQSRDDMYEVDTENELVRLKPEEDWFGEDEDDDQEEWEREGYNSEIAWENRWRDYRDSEDDSDEEEDRDPYSPWNMDY